VEPPTSTLILLVLAHGRERLVYIAYHGIVETDLQRLGCWRQLLPRGFVELICYGGDGLRASYLMEALSRLGESLMVTVMLWTLIQKSRMLLRVRSCASRRFLARIDAESWSVNISILWERTNDSSSVSQLITPHIRLNLVSREPYKG